MFYIIGETRKGRCSCGHKAKKGEPYYLEHISNEESITWCNVCGDALDFLRRAKKINIAKLLEKWWGRKERNDEEIPNNLC